ncbi:MAG: FxLYD domain-containing protein [Anaerolineae bacterium]
MSVGITPKGLENWLSLAATPTPISAEAQEPTHGASVVIVEWTTEAEVDLAGFNLYRSESPDGPYVKLNTTLIPGGSDSLLGGKYSYTDTNVVVGHTYYYKLEDVELDGTTTLHGPIEVVAEKWSIPKPTPTPTPILAAKPAFEVKKVRYAWSIYGKTCVRAAVVIRNKGTRTVWLSDITFTVYDVNGKVLEVLPAWWIVPRIIRAREAAYANAEAMEDLGNLEPSRVGELKVNFDYFLTDEEPQLLTVENFSGEEGFIGYDVLGEVVNTSGESAGEIHVAVALYDENNNLLDVLDTHLSTTLASGDRVGFRAGSSCDVSPEVWKQVKRFEGVAHNLKWQW